MMFWAGVGAGAGVTVVFSVLIICLCGWADEKKPDRERVRYHVACGDPTVWDCIRQLGTRAFRIEKRLADLERMIREYTPYGR